MRWLLTSVILIFTQTVLAFSPEQWSPGLHLLTGAGLNTSTYKTQTESIYLGWGSNLLANAGWYFNDQWAAETSAYVKFNKLKSNLIWNTLLTLGVRYRISDYYVRGFGGVGLLVVSVNDEQPFSNTRASRLHMEGPVAGLGFGRLYKNTNNFIWFWETSGTIQTIRHRDEVIMDGEVSISVANGRVTKDPTIHSLHLTVGVLLF